MSKQLGIPDGYQFIISVALGYKAEENQAAGQKDRCFYLYQKNINIKTACSRELQAVLIKKGQ